MTKTSKTSEAFYALALGWELDEAQSLHAEAEKALQASLARAQNVTCSKCGGECSHYLLPQAEQAGISALATWLTGGGPGAAKEASRLWEQVEAEGDSVCLACFNG